MSATAPKLAQAAADISNANMQFFLDSLRAHTSAAAGAIDSVTRKLIELDNNASPSVNRLINKALEAISELPAQFNIRVMNPFTDITSILVELPNAIGDTAAPRLENILEKIKAVFDALDGEAGDLKGKLDAVNADVIQLVQDLVEKSADTNEATKAQVQDLLEKVDELVQEFTAAVTEVINDAKNVTSKVIQGVREEVETVIGQVKATVNQGVESLVGEAKSQVNDKIQDTQAVIKQAAVEFDKVKTGILPFNLHVSALKPKINDATTDLKALQESIFAKLDALRSGLEADVEQWTEEISSGLNDLSAQYNYKIELLINDPSEAIRTCGNAAYNSVNETIAQSQNTLLVCGRDARDVIKARLNVELTEMTGQLKNTAALFGDMANIVEKVNNKVMSSTQGYNALPSLFNFDNSIGTAKNSANARFEAIGLFVKTVLSSTESCSSTVLTNAQTVAKQNMEALDVCIAQA